eukprot:scaffold3666_cov21-Tisochrysis_lutea.AAC.1
MPTLVRWQLRHPQPAWVECKWHVLFPNGFVPKRVQRYPMSTLARWLPLPSRRRAEMSLQASSRDALASGQCARQLESLARLAEARARVELRQVVTREDAE